jgi:ubiquinone/menaquinone biosynthesis C-methylase UbiE
VNEQKKVAKTFDEYESTYSSAVNKALSFTGTNVDFFTRVKADYLSDIITNTFTKNDSLRALDIGCGVGNIHNLLLPLFSELNGIDVSNSCVDKARVSNPGVIYNYYDGHKLPYSDNSFDIVFAICVVHHVPQAQWPDFFAEMQRVVKPGGIALIFEHNPLNPLTRKIVNDCPFDEDAVLLSRKKTEELFKNALFDNVKSQFIISVPPINKIGRKLDRFFSRLQLGAQYYTIGRKVG